MTVHRLRQRPLRTHDGGILSLGKQAPSNRWTIRGAATCAGQLRTKRAEIKTVVSTKERRRDRRTNSERVLPFVRDNKPAIQRSGHVTTGVRAAERELAIHLMV